MFARHGETRAEIASSFPPCPSYCLDLCRPLKTSVLPGTERAIRAWTAGCWAKAVLDGRAALLLLCLCWLLSLASTWCCAPSASLNLALSRPTLPLSVPSGTWTQPIPFAIPSHPLLKERSTATQPASPLTNCRRNEARGSKNRGRVGWRPLRLEVALGPFTPGQSPFLLHSCAAEVWRPVLACLWISRRFFPWTKQDQMPREYWVLFMPPLPLPWRRGGGRGNPCRRGGDPERHVPLRPCHGCGGFGEVSRLRCLCLVPQDAFEGLAPLWFSCKFFASLPAREASPGLISLLSSRRRSSFELVMALNFAYHDFAFVPSHLLQRPPNTSQEKSLRYLEALIRTFGSDQEGEPFRHRP